MCACVHVCMSLMPLIKGQPRRLVTDVIASPRLPDVAAHPVRLRANARRTVPAEASYTVDPPTSMYPSTHGMLGASDNCPPSSSPTTSRPSMHTKLHYTSPPRERNGSLPVPLRPSQRTTSHAPSDGPASRSDELSSPPPSPLVLPVLGGVVSLVWPSPTPRHLETSAPGRSLTSIASRASP